MMSKKTVLAAIAVAVVASGLVYTFLQSGRINAAYVDALADCKAGLGAGRLQAVDALYGKSSRPRKLATDLSLCDLDQAVENYKRAVDALD
jgi:hypothetical protein